MHITITRLLACFILAKWHNLRLNYSAQEYKTLQDPKSGDCGDSRGRRSHWWVHASIFIGQLYLPG